VDYANAAESKKPRKVRYEQINAMLLNEFLKEHHKVQEQQKQIDSLKTELKEQLDLIQKVSAKVETMEPAGLVTKNP
jgi:hypothetical protein